MAGVRLATGYIEITAETSKVPKQIQDALDKAGTAAAKPAGEKIGKDISDGLRDGMNTNLGTSGKQISDTITKTANAKAAGKVIGTQIAEGVKQGTAQIGPEVKTNVNDALKNLRKETLDEVRGSVREFGNQVTQELARGDVKGAFSDVGDVAKNTTDMITNAGEVLGVHLDGLRNFGTTIATGLEKAGDAAQSVTNRLTGLHNSLTLLRGGDVTGGIQGLSDGLRGVVPDSLLNKANTLLSTFTTTRQTIRDSVDTASQLRTALGLGAPAAGGALATIGGATGQFVAGPVAQVVGTSLAGNWLANQIAPHLGQQRRGVLWPIQQGMEMPGKWGNQIMSDIFGPAVPNPPQAPPTPQQFTQGAAPTILGAPPGPPVVHPQPGETPTHTIERVITAPPTPAAAAPSSGGGPVSVQAPSASVSASSAAISVVSATIAGGVSLPATSVPGALPGGRAPSMTAPTGVSGTRSWFQSGGEVPGVGPVPIIAHGGEHVLTQEEVKALGGPEGVKAVRHALQQGIADMNTQRPPETPGKPGGPNQADGATEALDVARTMGLIPQGAGSKAVAGTSMIAGFLNLGNEAVGGLIDAAASAAQQGIAMGAAAGSFGAGGSAAASASSIPIGIAANEGKRAVSYGFQLASIAADSLVDQIFGPFGGPPRWIGYDYSQFMPQIDVGQIATTTVEKAFQAAGAAQRGQGVPEGQQPGGPVLPQMIPGAQPAGPPVPSGTKFGEMAQTTVTPPPSGIPLGDSRPGLPARGAAPLGAPPPPGEPPPPGPSMAGTPPPPPPPPITPGPPPPRQQSPTDVFNPTAWLGLDEGGMWPSGVPAINTTGRPELVLSPQQLDAMKTGSTPQGWGSGDTYHITAMDAVDVARQIDSRKQLAMMRYSVRP